MTNPRRPTGRRSGHSGSESGAEQIARRAGAATALVYEALLTAHDHLNIGIAVTGGPRIVYANDALCRMYGYTAEELQAMPSFLDIVVEDDRPRLAERLRSRLQGTEASDVGSTTVVRKDGSHLDHARSPDDSRCRTGARSRLSHPVARCANERVDGLWHADVGEWAGGF